METWMWVLAGAVVMVVLPRILGGPRASADVIKAKIKAGARVVDVRSPEEFRGGAYPGATNIPVQSLQSRLRELKKDTPVVLYCASGARSSAAAGILKSAGFVDVINAGGLRSMPR